MVQHNHLMRQRLMVWYNNTHNSILCNCFSVLGWWIALIIPVSSHITISVVTSWLKCFTGNFKSGNYATTSSNTVLETENAVLCWWIESITDGWSMSQRSTCPGITTEGGEWELQSRKFPLGREYIFPGNIPRICFLSKPSQESTHAHTRAPINNPLNIWLSALTRETRSATV